MDPNAGKKKLMNRLGREDAIEALHAENFSRITTSFYRYVDIADPEAMRDLLYEQWSKLGVFGRVYLAQEGINAQISVPEHNWNEFIEVLHNRKEFADMHQKIAIEDDGKSFFKLMLKTKSQIVADGLEYGEYDISNVGTHLDAKAWNDAMDEGAIVVDMRNHYESEIGHFEGAICPQSETFREELPEVLEDLKGKEGIAEEKVEGPKKVFKEASMELNNLQLASVSSEKKKKLQLFKFAFFVSIFSAKCEQVLLVRKRLFSSKLFFRFWDR